MLVVLGVGGDGVAVELVPDLVQLPEQRLLQLDKTGVAEQVDVVVLIALGKAVSGGLRVYPRHDCRSNDWDAELAEAFLVLFEQVQQYLGQYLLVLDVGEQLELFEVLELDPSLEPEVDLVVSGKEQASLVLADFEQQVHVFGRLQFVLLAARLVSLQKLLDLGEVPQLLRPHHVLLHPVLQSQLLLLCQASCCAVLLYRLDVLFHALGGLLYWLVVELVNDHLQVVGFLDEAGVEQQLQFWVVALVVHHAVDPLVLEPGLGLEVLVVAVALVVGQEVLVLVLLPLQHPLRLLLHEQLLPELLLELHLRPLIVQVRTTLL